MVSGYERVLRDLLGYLEQGYILAPGQGIYGSLVDSLRADGYADVVMVYPEDVLQDAQESERIKNIAKVGLVD